MKGGERKRRERRLCRCRDGVMKKRNKEKKKDNHNGGWGQDVGRWSE